MRGESGSGWVKEGFREAFFPVEVRPCFEALAPIVPWGFKRNLEFMGKEGRERYLCKSGFLTKGVGQGGFLTQAKYSTQRSNNLAWSLAFTSSASGAADQGDLL